MGRLKINRRIFWGSLYFCDFFSSSAVAIKLATPFNLLLLIEIFQPFHSFHSFHPDTHPTFAALNHLLHLPSFLYESCRLLTSSLTRSHSAFLSTTHTTLRFTPPGSLLGPGRSRATRSLPVRLGPTRSTGTLPAHADSESFPGHIPARLGPTRIAGGSSPWADSDSSVQSRHCTSTIAAPTDAGPPHPRADACLSRSQCQW